MQPDSSEKDLPGTASLLSIRPLRDLIQLVAKRLVHRWQKTADPPEASASERHTEKGR